MSWMVPCLVPCALGTSTRGTEKQCNAKEKTHCQLGEFEVLHAPHKNIYKKKHVMPVFDSPALTRTAGHVTLVEVLGPVGSVGPGKDRKIVTKPTCCTQILHMFCISHRHDSA